MQPNLDRDPRVRFKHPVRVVPIGGPPRAYRVLASNLSKEGMFLRMPTPFDTGTKVALSLEAGGRVLPFAQAEVVWRDLAESKQPGRGAGFGVRFTGFLHPRAHELVDYLVANLETGKPLSAPVGPSPWRKRMVWLAVGLGAVALGAAITFGVLQIARSEKPPEVALQAAPEPLPEVIEVAEQIAAAPIAADSNAADPVAADSIVAAPIAAAPVAADPTAADPTAATPVVAEPVAKPVVAEAIVAKRVGAEAIVAKRVVAPEPVVIAAPAQTLPIPSGAVRSISATLTGDQLALSLTLAPGAAITKAFTLRNPDRLAIDVRGPAPRRSHVVSGTAEIRKIRVGKLGKGTRVVLDLSRAPGKPVVVSGSSVSVPLR